MKVVAPALAAIASLVDESTDNMDTEPADGALFPRRVQIRRAESERIERRPIVNETYPEAARPPPECHGDMSTGRMRSMTMRYDVGEELVENDQSRDRSSSGRPHSCANASAKACSRMKLRRARRVTRSTLSSPTVAHLAAYSLLVSCIKENVINRGGRNWVWCYGWRRIC